MKKLSFALAGAASLLVSACGGNDADTLNEAQDNTTAAELNALAENAAADANAELEALGTQEQQQQADENAAAEENAADQTPENLTDPARVEEDVQGM